MARVWWGWWYSVSGFTSGVLVAGALTASVMFLYWQQGHDTQAQAGNPPTVYLREEFASSIFGKSEDQVLDAVGKPDTTSEDAQATYWHYRRRTRNPATGSTDSDACRWSSSRARLAR